MTKQQVMQALEMLVKEYVKQLEQAGELNAGLTLDEVIPDFAKYLQTWREG